MSVYDTAEQEDYNRWRQSLWYKLPIDVTILMFSVADLTSYQNVRAGWISQKPDQLLNIPIVLVGNKTDLRTDSSHLKWFAEYKKEPVTTEMGKKLAREMNAAAYVESCCVDGTRVENVFEKAIWAALEYMPVVFRAKAKKALIKAILVGDADVGKTCLARKFTFYDRSNVLDKSLRRFKYPGNGITAFIEIDGEEYGLMIWERMLDVEGNGRVILPFERDIDVCMALFSVVDLASYKSIEDKWLPEVKQSFPKAVVVLVGNNTDLRRSSKLHVTTEMGEELRRRINAAIYLECSSSDGEEVEHVFEETVWASLRRAEKRRKKKSWFYRFFYRKWF